MYSGVRRVRIAIGLTGEFEIELELCHGFVLSSYLFVLIALDVSRDKENQSSKLLLLFFDDLTL